MSDKTRNYIYYAALIFFFFINIVTLIHGFKYSGFASKKDFQGTNFGMLIFLSAIGGYILTWLASLGFVIVTYVYKNL